MIPSVQTAPPGAADGQLPPVSVVLAVYNGARYLREAVASLTVQTYADYELVIVDDGSRDATPAIIAELAAGDARIRNVWQPNAGHAAALNRGIAEARYEWIARMDHDDRCAPDRLEAQLRFLVEHPDVHLLGSHATEIDEMGRAIGYLSIGPASAAVFDAQRASNDVIALIHPSVMFRRDTVLSVGGYRVPDSFADIDLWSRVADQHRVQVIARPLLEYRVHAASMTNARFLEMQRGLRIVRARQAARRRGAPEPSYDEFAADERQQTLPRRLARGRTDWALLLSKRALTHWNSGRRARALIELSGSCALRPVASARRATQRVMRARRAQG